MAANEKKSVVQIDAVTCELLIEALSAEGSGLSARARRDVARASNDQCVMESTDEVAEVKLADERLVSATGAQSCSSRERTYAIKVLAYEAMHARMTAYMCMNGQRAWKYAEPFCRVTSIPGYSGVADTCRVINNNTAVATPHMDFHIFPWPIPFWNRYGWMEFKVYAGYVWGNPYGFCCQ